ncbi:TPA: hypothetical protein R4762_001608 [Campylobacter jejuni]|nr:hypothetical protein [Campylobacter jejuni]
MEKLKKLVEKYSELKIEIDNLREEISSKKKINKEIEVLGQKVTIKTVFNRSNDIWLTCSFDDHKYGRYYDNMDIQIALKILELDIKLYITISQESEIVINLNRLCEIKQAFIEALEKIGLKAE